MHLKFMEKKSSRLERLKKGARRDDATYEKFRASSLYSIITVKIGFNPIWRHGQPLRRQRRQSVEARQQVRRNYQKHV